MPSFDGATKAFYAYVYNHQKGYGHKTAECRKQAYQLYKRIGHGTMMNMQGNISAFCLIIEVSKNRKIVGADIVELSPISGFIAPDFLAAKLVYKIISFILK